MKYRVYVPVLVDYHPFMASESHEATELGLLVQYAEHYGERLGENDASGGNDEECQIRYDFEMDLLAWLDRKFDLGLEQKFGDAWERGNQRVGSDDE